MFRAATQLAYAQGLQVKLQADVRLTLSSCQQKNADEPGFHPVRWAVSWSRSRRAGIHIRHYQLESVAAFCTAKGWFGTEALPSLSAVPKRLPPHAMRPPKHVRTGRGLGLAMHRDCLMRNENNLRRATVGVWIHCQTNAVVSVKTGTR